MVFGYASSDSIDLDGQIADPDWLKEAMPEWFSNWGNIRFMHQAIPVGKAKDMHFDEKGPWLASKIVDDNAWNLVKEGVLNGYSIGIKSPVIRTDAKAPRGRIVGGRVIEVSLADRPSNDDSKFALVKSVGVGTWKDMQSGTVLKKTSLSFEDIRDAIGRQLDQMGQGFMARPLYRWVVETYPDAVVIQESETGKYYRVTYTVSEDGQVILGQAEEVEQTYVPATAKAAMAALYKATFEEPGRYTQEDRDKIDEADFGDPKNKKFPIVTAKDVKDAAKLIGHADDPEAVKKRIIEIAHHKGKEFVEALPASWTEDSSDKEDVKKMADKTELCKCGREMKMADGKAACPECGKAADECKCEALNKAAASTAAPVADPAPKTAEPDVAKAGRKVSGERLTRLKEIQQQLGSFIQEVDDLVGESGGEEGGAGSTASKAATTDGVSVKGKMDYSQETALKEIKAQVAALAAQVDAALKGLAPEGHSVAGSIPATGHDQPGDPTAIKSSVADIANLVAAEVAKALSPDPLAKAVAADSTKAVLADLVKAAVDAAAGELRQRLEKVEQAAAPAKGGVIEVDRIFAGNPDNVVSDVRKAVDLLTETANDSSEAAQLKRAQAMYSLSQMAQKS